MLDGALGLRIKGQSARDLERFQIREIHLRRHPQQGGVGPVASHLAVHRHLDLHANLSSREMPGHGFGGRLDRGLDVRRREWCRAAQREYD